MTGGSLTEQQVADFNRLGYLAPLPALGAEETARFRFDVEDLEERCGGSLEASRLPQPQLHYAWAYELATHEALLDAVESLIGPDILVHSASIFSKSANSRAHVDWHQDGSYWELSSPEVVSAWVALSDSTPENGCLRVLPATHTLGTLPFTDDPDSPDKMLRSGLRVLTTVDEGTAVDLVLQPGEASLHHVNTIHGSAANLSTGKRIGFAVRYLPPHVSQPNPRNEVLVARGRDDYGHYPVRAEPPTATTAQGLAAHLEHTNRVVQRWMDARNRITPG